MQYTASHSIVCNAPRPRVYGLIRHSAAWPQVFEPCQAVKVLESAEDFEHIEVTALVNGQPMSWQSRRRFLPEVFGIESTLTRPMKLVRAMSTSWRVAPISAEQCLLVLEHAYELDEDVRGQVEDVHTHEQAHRFIDSAIDANSTTELGNIKAAVEREVREESEPRLDRHNSISVVCEAPADSVYAVIRDAGKWPHIFDSCISATRLEGDGAQELVRIEADQGGHRVAWNTHRRYFDAIRRIDYHLPEPMPFLASMQGQWRVLPLGPRRCLLTVDRSWRMLDDVRGIREGVETVAQATAIFDAFVNENAQSEMRAIRDYVEGGSTASLSCTTSHDLPFAPDEVYCVLANVAAWPDMLPHCEDLRVVYDDAQYQEFCMRVQTSRGTENFRSIRRCDAQSLTISYFQPEPPAVLRTHHGSWQVRSVPGGARVIAHHSVLFDEGACVAAFGDSDAALHKRRIKELLNRNSAATIAACEAWLQGAALCKASVGVAQ